MFIRSGLKARASARESQSWPTTGGKILSIRGRLTDNAAPEVDAPHGLHAVVRYAYEAGGASHQGATIRFGDVSSARRSTAERIVEKYTAGSACAIYYNPEEPTVSTLETVPGSLKPILFGFIFLLVPAFVLLVGGFIFYALNFA